MRYDIRQSWPGVYYPRSGAAPTAQTVRVTDAASMFCAAQWRYVSGVWVAPITSTYATATDFGVGNPGRALVGIPPWTRYLGWRALVKEPGAIYVRRSEVDGSSDVGEWEILTYSTPGDHDRLVIAYTVDSSEPASQERGCVHTNASDGAWHTIEISWYLTAGTEIAWLGFECLSPGYSGDGIG